MPYESDPTEDRSAKSIVPVFLNDKAKRKKYGVRIAEYCNAAKTQVGRLKSRWREVDDANISIYRETLKRPWPTAPVYNFPVMRPKLQQGTDFVANPLTQSDPYVIVKAGGPAGERAYAVERTLHLFNARSQYSEMVRYAMDVIQRRGKCWVRSTYNAYGINQGRTYWPCIQNDVFSPEHMRTFPASANTVDEMIFIGHEYKTTIGDVRRKQKSGLYFKDTEMVGSCDKDEWDERLLQDRSDRATTFDESPVDLVEGFIRFDEDDKQEWYQVLIDPRAEHILRAKPYPHRRPWYTDISIHLEYMRSTYENSRGSDLLGPQYYSNDIRNLTTWLAMWNGMAPMFAQNGALPDDVQVAQPGMVYPLAYGGNMFTPKGTIDISGLGQLIQMAQVDADVASGLSAQANGMSSSTSPTATEIMRIGQGQDMAVSGDMVHAGFGLSRMAEFITCDLLYTYFDDWYEHLGVMLPKVSQPDFDLPFWFEANGQSPSMPQMVFAQVNEMIVALSNMMRISPEIAIRYPELVPGLLRTALEQINANMKDTMMPEEEDEQANGNSGADTDNGGFPSVLDGLPGMGVPVEQGMEGAAPATNGVLAQG